MWAEERVDFRAPQGVALLPEALGTRLQVCVIAAAGLLRSKRTTLTSRGATAAWAAHPLVQYL